MGWKKKECWKVFGGVLVASLIYIIKFNLILILNFKLRLTSSRDRFVNAIENEVNLKIEILGKS